MAAAVRLDELDVVAAAEDAVDDDGVARRHRGGEGIDHQQDAHCGTVPEVRARASCRWLGSGLTDR